MTMAIRQHWIPQFYLRSFATSLNGKTLWVTNVKAAYAGAYQALKYDVTNVAQLSHLYLGFPQYHGHTVKLA